MQNIYSPLHPRTHSTSSQDSACSRRSILAPSFADCSGTSSPPRKPWGSRGRAPANEIPPDSLMRDGILKQKRRSTTTTSPAPPPSPAKNPTFFPKSNARSEQLTSALSQRNRPHLSAAPLVIIPVDIFHSVPKVCFGLGLISLGCHRQGFGCWGSFCPISTSSRFKIDFCPAKKIAMHDW